MQRPRKIASRFQPLSWCRFSLRTLLIAMAVVGVMLGWNTHQVRERQKTLRRIDSLGGRHVTYQPEVQPGNGKPPRYWAATSFPRLRLLLGDIPIYYINMVRTTATWQDRERVARLFPEAFVVPEHPDRFHPAE